jgi:hypothetical protein
MRYELDEEIAATPALVEKIKTRVDYAQNLYAAFCNMRWQKSETFPILKNDLWHVSWRSAGSVIAELRGEGDYLDWYCSGMGGLAGYDDDEDWDKKNFVPEACVTEEILHDLKQLGWHPVPWEDDPDTL